MKSSENKFVYVYFVQTNWFEGQFRYICSMLPDGITTQANIVEEKKNDSNFELKLPEC